MEQNNEIMNVSDVGLVPTVNRVKEQVQLIQHVMKQTMKEDEHFGTISGCKKPTLYKSGAEKLLLTFKMAPSYSELSVVETDNFISYRMQCSLTHITTSNLMGSGLGACNSKENKFATRMVYSNKATEDDYAKMIREEEREGNYGKYKVLIIPQNPWDLQNTLYKMACKRALIAAVLNVTAASDIFTQDLDDDFVPEKTETTPPKPPKRKSDAPKEPQNNSNKKSNLSEKQIKRLFAIANKNSWSEKDIKLYYESEFGIESSNDLTKEQYDNICDFMEQHPNGLNE